MARGVKELQANKDESESLIENLRAAAAESGVSRFAGTFEAVAVKHDSSGKRWLAGTIACGVLAIAFAFLFLVEFPVPGDLAKFENVYILVTRVVVIGLMVAACGWCASMFRVRAHLAEVNRHRATALATFTLFVESAQGEAARNTALEASLRTVFAPGLTGLVSSRDEKANNEMFGIIQSLVKGG